MAFGRSVVTSGRRRTARVGVVLVVLSMTRSAAADDKQICLDASEKAQQLKIDGKLVEAREQLALCSQKACPKLVRQDCTQWMSELLTALPSVVPAAKDRKGRDIVDVRVSVDGKVLTETLDGKALVIDPGVHSLHFETSGAPARDETVVVKPGEKNRIVTVTFATGDDDAATPSGPAAGTDAQTGPTSSSSAPVAAYVFGSLGVAALGAALIVQLGANSDAGNLRDTCAPKCKQSDVDDIQTKYTIAGVTAGVGGALVITGALLFLLRGGGSGSRAGARTGLPSVTFRPSQGGGGAVLLF